MDKLFFFNIYVVFIYAEKPAATFVVKITPFIICYDLKNIIKA